MKKILYILGIILASGMVFFSFGEKVDAATAGSIIHLQNPLDFDSFGELINKLINFIFTIGIILAPLMYILAGIYFVIAAGDPQKVTTAKNIILWTTVGLLIILLARGLIYVIKSVIGW